MPLYAEKGCESSESADPAAAADRVEVAVCSGAAVRPETDVRPESVVRPETDVRPEAAFRPETAVRSPVFHRSASVSLACCRPYRFAPAGYVRRSRSHSLPGSSFRYER